MKLKFLKLMSGVMVMSAVLACSSDSDSQSSEPDEGLPTESSASQDSSDVDSGNRDSSDVHPSEKDSSTVSPDSSSTKTADLVFIQASGNKVTLGTNSPSAKAIERPEMMVKLAYDFYIGKHEVTCAEFTNLRKDLGDKAAIKCEGDNRPISDITFYDAVLHANAQSKQEGLDTAYRYSAATFDSHGSGMGLRSQAKFFGRQFLERRQLRLQGTRCLQQGLQRK